MDPYFITSNNATQKGNIVLMILARKVIEDGQTIMPMLFHELFQNLTCTNFMEVKYVMDARLQVKRGSTSLSGVRIQKTTT